MKTSRMFELSKQLQELAQMHSYEDFRDAITQSCYDYSIVAAIEGRDVVAQQYMYLGIQVNQAAIDEPEFTFKETE